MYLKKETIKVTTCCRSPCKNWSHFSICQGNCLSWLASFMLCDIKNYWTIVTCKKWERPHVYKQITVAKQILFCKPSLFLKSMYFCCFFNLATMSHGFRCKKMPFFNINNSTCLCSFNHKICLST